MEPVINIKEQDDLMKESEKETYDNNLAIYSSIVREKIKDVEMILDCIRLLEYFEDYEKCEHLLRIIKEIENPKIL